MPFILIRFSDEFIFIFIVFVCFISCVQTSGLGAAAGQCLLEKKTFIFKHIKLRERVSRA